MEGTLLAHQESDLETVCAQMEKRLTLKLETRLAEQQGHHDRQLVAQHGHHDRQLAEQKEYLDTQLEVVHSLVTVPYVSNVAAQCLNAALGNSAQRPESRTFQSGMGRADPRIRGIVHGIFGKTAHTECGGRLDVIINRRNRSIHHNDTPEGLRLAVSAALGYINNSQAVRLACADEMLVLGAFDVNPELLEAND